MMKKKVYYLIGVVVLILVLVIAKFLPFGKEINPLPFSASQIFTEDVYKQLKEIDYWAGDTKLVINNQADMKSFYSYLTSMKLRRALSPDRHTDGGLNVDLVMENETISIGWRSFKININDKGYYVVKDISDGAREIAMKYMDYYKNDVFTKNMFEDLVEMDCWVNNEKVVMNDSERLEEAYHYLSGLTLEEASPDYKFITEPMKMNLVTKDATIRLSVTSTAISINDKIYYADGQGDHIQFITTIANENHK
jgi:hypothetical protein